MCEVGVVEPLTVETSSKLDERVGVDEGEVKKYLFGLGEDKNSSTLEAEWERWIASADTPSIESGPV